jgi:hypothetical protein
MIYRKNKFEIAATVLAQIGDDPDNPWKDISIDKLVFAWWVTGRAGDGLRLTVEGSKAFEYAKIAHYNFPFDKSDRVWTATGWERYAVVVNRKLQCPHFISHNVVRVYDHKIAMLLGLFGSLTEYIEVPK